MGFAKRQLEEYDARGYGEIPETYVCADCIGNPGLKKVIKDNAIAKKCSYCQRQETVAIAAPLEKVVEAIAITMGMFFERAVDGTPYCSQEGGYIGETFNLRDALDFLELDISSSKADDLYDDMFSAWDDGLLVESNPSITGESQRCQFGWKSFVHQVKHRTRYMFADIEYPLPQFYEDYYPTPNEMLPIILDFIKKRGLINKLSKGECFYRGRVVDQGEVDKETTAKGLGTAPKERARYSNRMSPAGVPMFYGSSKLETARKEVLLSGQSTPDENKVLIWGKFELLRDIYVIDLYKHHPICFFDRDESPETLNSKLFLNHFSREISQPIKKIDKAWIDYVPTQIVAEYLRYKCTFNNDPIRGILFASSTDAGKNCVMFFENDSFGNTGTSNDKVFFQLVDKGRIDLQK